MKRRLEGFFVLLLGLALLSACGQKAPEDFQTSQVEALVNAGVFSEELEELEGEIAFSLYQLEGAGLSLEQLEDSAVLRSAGATCEEAAVLIFAQESQAQQAKTALEGYLSGQIEANRQYRPEDIPKLEQAILEQRGKSVVLVVCAEEATARTQLGIS